MKRQDTKQVLEVLLAAYRRTELDPETVIVYSSAINGYPLDAAMIAVRDWIATQDKFPTVSELRRVCGSTTRRLAQLNRPRELELPISAYKEPATRGLQKARDALHKGVAQQRQAQHQRSVERDDEDAQGALL